MLLALATLVPAVSAQDVKPEDLSPATKRYRAYRLQPTEPPFGLSKVKALVARIKPDKEDNRRLSAAAFDRLTAPERFTYCMVHGEDASQNCDAMPWIVDEEHKVFARSPGFFGEEIWSDRQLAFLRSHRSDVVRLLRRTIRARRRVGSNLKDTVEYLHANELIPDLIWAYDLDHKDHDILTTLMVLMGDGKFKPFLESLTYKKLYGENASSQSYIVANEANQKLMAERAMAFYRSRVR